MRVEQRTVLRPDGQIRCLPLTALSIVAKKVVDLSNKMRVLDTNQQKKEYIAVRINKSVCKIMIT